MKQIEIKRKEVQGLINGLSGLKGLKNFNKSISLGRDIRVLKGVQEEIEEALKACKPIDYDSLSDELRELKQKKVKEFEVKDGEILNDKGVTEHVLLTWPKLKAWNEANKTYNSEVEKIYNSKITIDLHTDKLEEKDFEKAPRDVATCEALSFLM